MEREEFKKIRKILKKTQLQMAQLLGVSKKAVHSYEQGWRTIPVHVERQMLFLISMMKEHRRSRKPCWVVKKCSPEIKKLCPAWEFQAGKLCWFINGTICSGDACKDWKEKIASCRSCEVLMSLLSILSE